AVEDGRGHMGKIRRPDRTRLRRSSIGAAVLVLVVGAALVACDVQVSTFTVNTTADGHDALPGDGVCEMTPGAGDCSLRAAIDEAAKGPEFAVVDVPAGGLRLDSADGPIEVPTGAANVNVRSDGTTVVDASGLASAFDVAGSLTMEGFGVQGAAVQDVHVQSQG